jgi:hypothetical protein
MYLHQRCKEMIGMRVAVPVEQWTGRWQRAQKARRARSKAQRRQGRSRASGGQQGGCGASGERERGERNATPPAVCATAAGAQASSDGPSGRWPAVPGSSAIALLYMRASSADDCAALCCACHGRSPRDSSESSSREPRNRARNDCGEDGVCGARGRVRCPAAQQSDAAWTCVRWDSVGGQQALLSAAATAARAVQRRARLCVGLSAL